MLAYWDMLMITCPTLCIIAQQKNAIGSLLSAGLARGHRDSPAAAFKVHQLFCTPRLFSEHRACQNPSPCDLFLSWKLTGEGWTVTVTWDETAISILFDLPLNRRPCTHACPVCLDISSAIITVLVPPSEKSLSPVRFAPSSFFTEPAAL